MAIRIVATSDLHGNLPYIRENFDLMLICGDLCPTANERYEPVNPLLSYSFDPVTKKVIL